MLRAYKYRMYPSQEQISLSCTTSMPVGLCATKQSRNLPDVMKDHKPAQRFPAQTLESSCRREQAIAVESLNVAGMQKNHCLAQSISDVSWSAFFTMLEYKCQMHGKTLSRSGDSNHHQKSVTGVGTSSGISFLQIENGSVLTAVLHPTAISTQQSISRSSPCKIKILSGYQAWNAPKGLWTRSRWENDSREDPARKRGVVH